MNVIRVFNANSRYRIPRVETQKLIKHVLISEQKRDAELNIVFVNDAYMRKINGIYLNHWYTTDVLSFQLSEQYDDKLEGEVYVNTDQAKRQAKMYNATRKNEIARLVVHGVLHLLGYDDSTKHQRQRMRQMEDTYINKN